jgi:hypothetical protein
MSYDAMPLMVTQGGYKHPPVRVQVARGFIHQMKTFNPTEINGDGPQVADMSPEEVRAYNSALEVMRLYLTGENDYADPDPVGDEAGYIEGYSDGMEAACEMEEIDHDIPGREDGLA